MPKGTRVREYRDGPRVVIEPRETWPDGFAEALGSFPDEIPRPPSTAARSPFEPEARALSFVTHNRRHFDRVSKLVFEDWV